MARAGGRAGKVLSSGRLSLPVRPAACKKRAAVKKSSATSVDSGYSLCSSDSDDQVLVINRGLDRCAELLHDLLQCDVRENPLKHHTMPVPKGNVRSATVKAKKTLVRKPTTASHVYKEKGSLRKTFPPRLCNAEIQRPCVSSPPLAVSSQHLDHVTTQMQHLNHASAYSAPSAPGPEASALYNHRLPTSTPTLSPQHPALPQSSSHQDIHQTLPPGGASHFPSSTVASHSAFPMPVPIQAAPHNCTVPAGYQVTHQANVSSQLDHYKSLIRDSDLLQCVAAHLAQLQHSDGPAQNQAAAYTAESGCETERPLTESDDASGDEEEAVREISCQTSFTNPKKSPKKTERKIKTVKYLLGEIKSLVADKGDREAMCLVAELEHSLSLLPVVSGSTNVHAEIALALQPLRSENAQLRRRLRILNQQLRDRERGARSDEQNSEVSALQSMNETLQDQLNQSQKGLETLQKKNQELQKAMEIQEEESRRAAQVMEEREQEILHLEQQKDLTAANGKKDVDDAVGKMKSAQFKLEASEKENQILGISLRQRDAEVARLRELTRTLQASMAKLLCNLGKDSAKPNAGSGLTEAALGSYERQTENEQCPASTSILNYLKRLETDQVFTDAMYPEKPLIPTSDLQLTEDCMVSKSHDPKSTDPPGPLYSPHKPKGEIECEMGYVTSDEHGADETLYLPLVSSPCKSDSSQRRMCTPPKVHSMDQNLDYRWQDSKHHGLGSSDRNPGVHKVSQYTPHVLDTISETHQPNSRPETSRRIPSQSYPPPVLQQMRSLQLRDDPPNDGSRFEGKTDWSICSFSTFTSHDEQDFRNGLAALDANIAKLHKSLQSASARK